MQPSIPAGTILQKRYRLVKTLGQGGFGRTYLAEDQDRFNELCVLKEYSPGQMGTYALQKSKELFQREAQVLYQIQHPQIPQFRASFEQGKRLFLVQDYVAGKTYSALIQERIEEGKTFSEAEAVQFMQQMLPVLEHIHSKGIIHRDISPDNIILRESDRLPVLIDFGVVKEGISKIDTENTPQGTTVGKLGYSPNEQLQTGQVYPNSDLYALAVTAVVLMTGKKPQELLDESTMTWRWHQWVPTLSSWFANVLNRMLNHRPSNRYQSATEVAQTLRSLSGLINTPNAETTRIEDPNAVTILPQSTVINRTTATRPTQLNSPPVPRRQNRNPMWDSPWILAAIGGAVILVFAVVPIMIISSMLPKNVSKVQTNSSSPITVNPTYINTPPPQVQTEPTPTPTPTPSAAPVNRNELVVVQIGETVNRQGNLKSDQQVTYYFSASQGQQLNASLNSGSVYMTVLAPNQELVNPQAKQAYQWQGTLPMNGDYYIQLNTKSNSPQDYKLDISLTTPPPPSTNTNDAITSPNSP